VTLSHGTFNGFSHGMCVHASRGSRIMCVSWAQARGFLQEDKPHLVVSCLTSPHLAWLEGFLSRKKLKKRRRHNQKYFIIVSVFVREGKNSCGMCDWLSPHFEVWRWSNECLQRLV